MYAEEDLLPVSALQHLVFCERQCALIHLEHVWTENLFTAKGRILHERVDKGGEAARGEVQIRYGLQLRALELGLFGRADAVEFYRDPENGENAWQPYPVEYKRGQPKSDDCDKVQLCAQALCLEEMLGPEISAGALFYGKIRRRQEVCFDEKLREKTKDAAKRLHKLINEGQTPPAVFTPKCRSCSLVEQCMPKGMSKRPVKEYLDEMVWGK